MYDETNYPVLDEFVEGMKKANDRPKRKRSLKRLAVNGCILKEPMSDYLQSKHIGSSDLKNALKSPKLFIYTYEKAIQRESRYCEDLGTFVHLALCEPKQFKKVKVEPSFNQAQTKGVIQKIKFFRRMLKRPVSKEEETDLYTVKIQKLRSNKEELEKECISKGFIFVSDEMYEKIQIIKQNIARYEGGIIEKVLKGAHPEISFYGKDEESGLSVKVRPDYFNVAENIGFNAVISIKTTSRNNIEEFGNDSARLLYDLSEGMYQEVMSSVTGRKFNVTIMIMIQTIPPFDVALLYWNAEDIQMGKEKYRDALTTVSRCFENGYFPGFNARSASGNFGFIEFGLPGWSKKELAPVNV